MKCPRGVIYSLMALLIAAPLAAEESSSSVGYAVVEELLSEDRKKRRLAAKQLAQSADPSLIPAIVDSLFFISKAERRDAYKTLEALAGENAPARDYYAWVELVGRSEIAPKEGYEEFKAELLTRIDPRFRQIFYRGAPAKIRLEEIVWGGVRLEGIPALDNPPHVEAADAGVLRDGEKVFGVVAGGAARAYPLRILAWHEMLNDTVGDEPITLSYCTLCGSGVLYQTRTPAGSAYTFGTSGLLYRSNKLMVDRQTLSLWSNLTGEPVVGRRARGDVRLEMLPLVITTWGAWRQRHPETTAVLPDLELGRRWGFDYRTGAADRARSGVAFPVWQQSRQLPRDEEVYALRLDGRPKAYRLAAVLRKGVVNDELGDRRLVLVGDPDSGAVRAYNSGSRNFEQGVKADVLVDDSGREWQIGEASLTLADGSEPPLERLPGHRAFWFGWFGFYPSTEVWGTEE